MNKVQKWMALLGLCFVLGQLLFPPWDEQWTVTYFYEFYHEGDLKKSDAVTATFVPENLKQHGQETTSYIDRCRAFVITGPRKPRPALPPPTREYVGTRTIDFGPRVTTYTKAAVTAFDTRIRKHDLLLQVLITAFSMIVMVAFCGGPTNLTNWRLPMDSYRVPPRSKPATPDETPKAAPRRPPNLRFRTDAPPSTPPATKPEDKTPPPAGRP